MHQATKNRISVDSKMIKSVCEVARYAKIRGLFFFQPPMGYKKKDKLT